MCWYVYRMLVSSVTWQVSVFTVDLCYRVDSNVGDICWCLQRMSAPGQLVLSKLS